LRGGRLYRRTRCCISSQIRKRWREKLKRFASLKKKLKRFPSLKNKNSAGIILAYFVSATYLALKK
jgi:hypothetical protein